MSRVVDDGEQLHGIGNDDGKRRNEDDEKTNHSMGPFAQRTGHTLSWTDVNMEVKTKNGKRRNVVNNLEGVVLPGQLTAIMGHRYVFCFLLGQNFLQQQHNYKLSLTDQFF